LTNEATTPEVEDLTRTTRDAGALREQLERWLAARLPEGCAPRVSELASPSATGMSSETLLFDASWEEAGQHRSGAFVARLAPEARDVPVFPDYDLEKQFRLLDLVRRHGDVPVPHVRWLERGREALGTPFFVMDRVEGSVPPDIMPYTFGSWLSDAPAADRRRLQDATVGVIAALHAIDPQTVDCGFLAFELPGATPLERHVENQRRYFAWARKERRHPILEHAFAWLEESWPEEEGATVISWGDSRIGNVLYRDFLPVAVLDWEMAALGPRELDLGWLVFMHRFFDDIASGAGFPGMPDFLKLEDVAAHYASLSSVTPHHLDFYELYAALRHGIVMTRVHERRVHFGQAEWPDDPDDVIPHRAALERMMERPGRP